MITSIIPKLPMRDKSKTLLFYNALGFQEIGNSTFEDYLMLKIENIELHFFKFEAIDPLENYGQIYIRVATINSLYKEFQDKNISIHPNGNLQIKPWGQKEFSLLDPDNNLLTFGESHP